MTVPTTKADFDKEVTAGERFEFGNNWARFLLRLNDKRIEEAKISLKNMLAVNDLRGRSFLDIGCGSGLFSLAAAQLAAKSIHSFDYDTKSVACSMELKRRFFPEMETWSIKQASILDEPYLEKLGRFDVVYSWGVLHHTGQMWKALENTASLVKPGGKLFIVIYNDQGVSSRIWLWIKRLYNRLPSVLRFLVVYPSFFYLWTPIFVRDLLKGKPGETWTGYMQDRGMSPWDDTIDWVGGYPFEVTSPGEIFTFFHKRGFSLQNMKTTHNLGCNEFVFQFEIPHDLH